MDGIGLKLQVFYLWYVKDLTYVCVHNRNQYMLAKDAKNPLARFNSAAIFCQLLIIIMIIITTKPRLGKMSIYADLVGRARVCVCVCVCVCGAQTYSDHHLPQMTM